MKYISNIKCVTQEQNITATVTDPDTSVVSYRYGIGGIGIGHPCISPPDDNQYV